MARKPQHTNIARNSREGNAYLPQVSPVEEFAPSGAPIHSVEYNNLPIEAKNIITTVKGGGNVTAFQRDGSRHGNYERNLPRGSYKEYTVTTTGRGNTAHRVLHRTDNNTFYYSGFHYADFALVKNIP